MIRYADPEGFYALDVPKSWTVQGNVGTKQPISVVEFVGSAEPQHEGEIFGAVLKVVRLPGTQPKSVREHTDKLFAKAKPAPLPNAPDARAYENAFTHSGGPMHGSKAIDVRVEGFVLKAPDAFYIVEYRAEDAQFEKHAWSLERAKSSFRLLTPP